MHHEAVCCDKTGVEQYAENRFVLLVVMLMVSRLGRPSSEWEMTS